MAKQLQKALQDIAATPTLDAQGAANVWAGTTGKDLNGALNIKNGTVGKERAGVIRSLNVTFPTFNAMEDF